MNQLQIRGRSRTNKSTTTGKRPCFIANISRGTSKIVEFGMQMRSSTPEGTDQTLVYNVVIFIQYYFVLFSELSAKLWCFNSAFRRIFIVAFIFTVLAFLLQISNAQYLHASRMNIVDTTIFFPLYGRMSAPALQVSTITCALTWALHSQHCCFVQCYTKGGLDVAPPSLPYALTLSLSVSLNLRQTALQQSSA